eukprot:Rhum_TRINITY_DN2313_c1_g1::Rhum_TRINITY_DN2313_c1_g1_i1::g.6803::m.6803
MQITACCAEESVSLELDEACRTAAALKAAVAEALPQLEDVDAFVVEAEGRAVDDEAVCGLVAGCSVDVVPSARALARQSLHRMGYDIVEHELERASNYGDVDLCRTFFDAGLSPNMIVNTRSHQSLLMLAAFYGNVDMCRLLLSRGADVRAADVRLTTPLHFAALRGRQEICELLLENDADAAARNKDGSTPGQEAAKRGRTELAAMLNAQAGL